MKQFRNRILISLLPCLVAAYVVGLAWYRYQDGLGGFKLGVDLVGGTILVYEVDVDKFTDEKQLDDFKPEELAASLKRRIDPTDLYNVVIRPVSKTRVEIILPTGGAHQEQADQENWSNLLAAIRQRWPHVANAPLEAVARGDDRQLATQVEEALKGQKVPSEEIIKFIKDQYGVSAQKRTLDTEEVNRIKNLIDNVGNLEFRILANARDDVAAIDAAQTYFAELSDPKAPEQEKAKRLQDLESRALRGMPPPSPMLPQGGDSFDWDTKHAGGKAKYSWVELGRQERALLGLNNASEQPDPQNPNRNARWKLAADARSRNATLQLADTGQTLLLSRKCLDRNLSPEERERKKYEYFLLTRDPPPDQAITGQYLVSARPGQDSQMRPAVNFTFNNTGGNLFHEVTSANRPVGPEGSESARRYLAIILDNFIVSAPTINSPIRTEGQISGPNFTQKDVDSQVRILKSGALPATLKRTPVSENTIGPTLGADTIAAGARSVVLAFFAVLAFMVFYYRFAGLVASVALLANLLLTLGFLVAVNATFTLPGIAGLVLTLGIAVDANVLIYERLREERDKGASLALAIRNGYDRSFPTIIDTHLTSILTGVILYAVGNDQLKGFGITLTAGLIISLFTSLYMTRLLFDIWLAKGWLRELRMFRFFSRTNIDFMGIRHYCLVASVLFSVFGLGLFLVRGENGLNIDFVGGTAYSGELQKPIDPVTLRRILAEESALKIKDVKPNDTEGYRFTIVYADGQEQGVRFPSRTTPEDVRQRAEHLPDWSVEQIFRDDPKVKPGESNPEESRFFTVRTSERATDLVLVSINRLLQKGGHPLEQVQVVSPIKVEGNSALLEFSAPVSPGHLKLLLEGEFQDVLHRKLQGQDTRVLRAVEVIGGEYDNQRTFVAGRGGDVGRFKVMRVEISDNAAGYISSAEFQNILERAKKEFADRPQPMRLENFDKALASDSQSIALYAILACQLVILAYIWFRFGNWTYGTAAVLCLVHDVLFTLGLIACCHYVYEYVPGLANLLLIRDFKIDLPAVASLLTLIGCSINDKIVVYDRIREVKGKRAELTPEIINDSINQALSRTVLTVLTVLLVLTVLYVFGGEGIHLFAFVMLVGMVIGTYSSIYVASPLLLMFKEGMPSQEKQEQPQPEAQEEEKEEEPETEVTEAS